MDDIVPMAVPFAPIIGLPAIISSRAPRNLLPNDAAARDIVHAFLLFLVSYFIKPQQRSIIPLSFNALCYLLQHTSCLLKPLLRNFTGQRPGKEWFVVS